MRLSVQTFQQFVFCFCHSVSLPSPLNGGWGEESEFSTLAFEMKEKSLIPKQEKLTTLL